MSDLEFDPQSDSPGGIPLSRILKYQADRDPDRPSVTMDDRTLTRRQLDESTNRLARSYIDLGVKPGDFVTIALPNSIEFYEAAFAVWKCGATPHLASWRLPLLEAQAIFDLVNPSLLIGGHPEVQVSQRLPEGFTPDSSISADALPVTVSRYWKAMSSGGSTGRPKIIVSHEESVFDPNAPVLGQALDKALLNVGPLYNNGPFFLSIRAIVGGNHVVVTPRFEEHETLQLIERHKIDYIFLVPTMMNRIWRLGADVRESFDLSSLRTVYHTASVCPVWLKKAWIDWLGPDRILEAYGGTEGQGWTLITGEEWLSHEGSVGRAAPGFRLAIMDEEGGRLPAGEIGEIFFEPESPAPKAFHYIGSDAREFGEASSVGDMGWIDSEGWLYISDRRTDLIVSGGSNIYPAEVEAALDSHPAVRSSIVIGLPDDDYVAAVHAIVQLDPDLPAPSADDLKTFMKGVILPYKIPRSFEFVNEYLRDDAGKARRSQLRDQRLTLRAAGLI